ALANYPTWEMGTPAIWPERNDVPIYHNRALWPFVSAYALRAARALDDPARIAHELRSIMRMAAVAGSNTEDAELCPAPENPEGVAYAPAHVARVPDMGYGSHLPRAGQHESPPPRALVGKRGEERYGLHAGEAERKGPLLNSKRQLWSIAGYLDMV